MICFVRIFVKDYRVSTQIVVSTTNSIREPPDSSTHNVRSYRLYDCVFHHRFGDSGGVDNHTLTRRKPPKPPLSP